MLEEGETVIAGGGRMGATNNFYVETPDARSFAENRTLVLRGAVRLTRCAQRHT